MIETPRLFLRQWRDDDLPVYAALNADPRVREFFPTVLTRSESDADAAGLRAHLAAEGWGAWAVEVVGKTPFAGWVGLGPPDFGSHSPPFKHIPPCIEIGWRLAHACWGQGYATEAARVVARFGFETLRLHEIISYAPEGNLRSRNVMTKLGMTRDPAEDFLHPKAPPNHPLARCVLYRSRQPELAQKVGADLN